MKWVYILLYVFVYTKVAMVQQNRSKMWDGMEWSVSVGLPSNVKMK